MGIGLFSWIFQNQFEAEEEEEEVKNWSWIFWDGFVGFWYGFWPKFKFLAVWEEGVGVCVSDCIWIVALFGAFAAGGGSEAIAGESSFMGRWGWFPKICV